MATGTINTNLDPTKWKQLFESALDELSGDTQVDRKKPIYQRKAVVTDEPEYKRTDRALTNAADALSALWKMSPSKPAFRSSK
ncbi:MAG TPA: hypothetical protein VFA68_01910 [Terriglobales bacterium]|nr:hypothetical protein [Terriglobales bacterium]